MARDFINRPLFGAVTCLACLITYGGIDAQEFNISRIGVLQSVNVNSLTVRVDTELMVININPTRTLRDGRSITGLDPLVIEITGQADAEVLQPGVVVRFVAQVARKKAVKDEVSQFTVVERELNLASGFQNADESDSDDADQSSRWKKMVVTGQIRTRNRRLITLAVPDGADVKTLKVRLAEETEVKLATSDISLARPGDTVTFEAIRVNELTPPEVVATKVQITPAKKDSPRVANGAKPKPTTTKPKVDGDPLAKKPPAGDAPVAEKPKLRGAILKIN